MTTTVPWGTLATYVREKPWRFFVYLHLHSAGQPFIQVSSLYETGGFTNLTQKVIIQLHQQYVLVTVPELGHMNTVRLPPQNPSILQQAPNYVTKRQVLRYKFRFYSVKRRIFKLCCRRFAFKVNSKEYIMPWSLWFTGVKRDCKIATSCSLPSSNNTQPAGALRAGLAVCCLLKVCNFLFAWKLMTTVKGWFNSDVLSLKPVLCFDTVSADLTNDGEHGNKWTHQKPFEYLVTTLWKIWNICCTYFKGSEISLQFRNHI